MKIHKIAVIAIAGIVASNMYKKHTDKQIAAFYKLLSSKKY